MKSGKSYSNRRQKKRRTRKLTPSRNPQQIAQIREEARLALLRMRHVVARTGLSRSTIYALIAQGKFPSQISLGTRSIGFIESEVDAWIASRIEASR